MVCPFCLHEKTEVYNSRRTKKTNETWRRRRCLACKKEFTTREAADPKDIFVVERKDHREPFSKAKLLLSLLKVSDHRKDHGEAIFYLAVTIEQLLYKAAAANGQKITTQLIVETVLRVLKRFDTAAYVKYLSYHSPQLDVRSLKRFLKRD
ncbi:MAG: ATP cone domain-containing protein [Candidatus Saccharimonadales bacterium]